MKEINKIKNSFFASCPHGFENILEKEIESYKVQNIVKVNGGIQFDCTPEKAIKVVLYSRVASRLFKRLYSFDIKTEKDIYFFASKIKWKSLMTSDMTFKINSQLGKSPDGKQRSNFRNSMYLSQVLKDAIVDQFRENEKKRPSVSKVDPDISFFMRVTAYNEEFAKKEKVEILLDLCFEPISNRGYKTEGFQAPLRENLAAGLVLLMEELPENKNFYDFMCGSGTALIEYAFIKGNIPASFLKVKRWMEEEERGFWAFENHFFFANDKYAQENFTKELEAIYVNGKKAIEDLEKSDNKILGSDMDYDAVLIAQKHIENAGLSEVIDVQTTNALRMTPQTTEGILFANPPYGERIGDIADLEHVYHDVGENLKQNFKNHVFYIITGNIPLLKKISLKTKKRVPVYNGNIECRLAKYELF